MKKEQNSSVDNTFIPDTSIINQLNFKAMANYREYPDSAIRLAHKALKLSSVIDYSEGIGNAYTALAYSHLMSFRNSDSTHRYFQLAYNIWHNLDDDKGLGLVCYGLGYFYSFKGNLAESEKFMLRALDYCQKAHFKRGLFNTYSALSYIHKQYKDFEKAYEYIDKAIDVASQTGTKSGLADLYNSKGNLYKDQAMFQHAIDTYFKALDLWEQSSDSSGIAVAFGSIANMYYYQRDYQKALEYYFKMLPICIRSKDRWEVSKAYSGIAAAYNLNHQYDSALLFLHKSLHLNRIMNFPTGIADNYFKLAGTFNLLANYDSASIYINKAIIIARNLNDKAKLAEYYVLFGELQLKLGNRKQAVQNIEQGYKIAKNLGMPFVISDASGLLSKIYVENGDYKKAYLHLSEDKLIQDSINAEEHVKRVTQLELQYEYDKKERKMEFEAQQERLAQEAAMQQQRMYLYGVISTSMLILFIGFLFFRQRILQDRFRAMELEQRLLLTQMNPHFIFNSLCAIQNFMVENNTREASRLLTRFSMLMRHILENSRAEFIPVADEIDTLKNYLEIQQLRFGKPFRYSLLVDEAIDPETYTIPPMLAQPFIENSIEHGLLPLKRKGEIKIAFQLNGNSIKLIIEDNGVGINQTTKNKNALNQKRSSLSTMLTMERLKHFRNRYKGEILLKIDDLSESENSTGTRVILQIPYQINYG